jgi:HemY protein
MKVFRNLLWWLALAALGALAWELLSPDLGTVLVRWHGATLTTTVAFFLLAWALLWLALWALWWLLRLPFTGWQRLAQREARLRLVNGLTALYQGHFSRAETLLAKAAEDPDCRFVALSAAQEAAARRGDGEAAARWQRALAEAQAPKEPAPRP